MHHFHNSIYSFLIHRTKQSISQYLLNSHIFHTQKNPTSQKFNVYSLSQSVI